MQENSPGTPKSGNGLIQMIGWRGLLVKNGLIICSSYYSKQDLLNLSFANYSKQDLLNLSFAIFQDTR